MNKNQLSLLALALGLTLGLYFIPTKPPKNNNIDRSRKIEMESTDESSLLRMTKEKYKGSELVEIQTMMDMLNAAKSENEKINWLEKISGTWYRIGEPALAGVYAQKIAEIKNDEEAWSIAGTSYAAGIRKYTEDKYRTFCFGRALKALENAISMNPDESQHRVNLAMCYVGMPPKDNPMKGVLMLRDLLDKNPEDVGVLTQLGGLAIQTGQYDKAIERLSKANSLEPNNKIVLTYLINAYKGKGDLKKASEYERILNKN